MKKTIQKMLSIMITIAMILVFGITSLAADTDKKIIIEKSSNDTATHKYEAYQIFTGTLDQNSNGDTILKDLQWGTGVDQAGLKSALGVTTDNIGDVASALESLSAADAAAIISANLATAYTSEETDARSAELTVAAPGYYFIKDTITSGENGAVSNYILKVVEDTDIPMNSKVDVPTINKCIDDGGDVEANNVSIGDTVTYKITSEVPDTSEFTSYDFIITDTLSAGLTLGSISSVKVGSSTIDAADYTYTPNGQSFTLKLDKIKSYTKGDAIEVIYTATLNENCVFDTDANTNTVNLQYSNNPNEASSKGTSPDIVTKTYTTGITINKVDKNGDPLTGAKFTISGNTINTMIVNGTPVDCAGSHSCEEEVDSTGTLSFEGLSAGTYTISEEAPSGYNSIPDMELVITFAYENGEAVWTYTLDGQPLTSNSMTVENEEASILPTTGGIGTTIFYVCGGLLLAGGVVLLVAKKRTGASK